MFEVLQCNLKIWTFFSKWLDVVGFIYDQDSVFLVYFLTFTILSIEQVIVWHKYQIGLYLSLTLLIIWAETSRPSQLP